MTLWIRVQVLTSWLYSVTDVNGRISAVSHHSGSPWYNSEKYFHRYIVFLCKKSFVTNVIALIFQR